MLSLTRRRLVLVFALFCCAGFTLTGLGTIVMAGWAPSWAAPFATGPSQASAVKKLSDAPATSMSYSILETEAWCGAPPSTWLQAEPVVVPPHEFPVTVPVSIMNFAFSPADVTINVGDTVTWTNNDGFTHTTTSNTAVWDSGNLAAGQTFSFTFTTAGSFPKRRERTSSS